MIPSIEPSEVGATGLLWLLISYGYILYYASNLISEGSDLLLLVPSLAGLVGGVVLPLLGAVPDGAIMLFSGLGDVEQAQETLSVGVGALAGSTIMLLTVPWALSVYYGRVEFSEVNGEPNYLGKPKLQEDAGTCGSLSKTGVAITPEIQLGAKMMMLTTLPYFLIQGPAFFLHGDRAAISAGEKYWALSGFIVCMMMFVWYLHLQLKMSNEGADKLRRMAVTKEALKRGSISLSGALSNQVHHMEKVGSKHGLVNEASALNFVPGGSDDDAIYPPVKVSEFLKGTLREAFLLYDENHNGTLEKKEFSLFLTDFHETITKEKLDRVFRRFDKNDDGTIDFNEFIGACYVIIKEASNPVNKDKAELERKPTTITKLSFAVDDNGEEGGGGGNGEEEETMPVDFTSLSPEEQQQAIKRRASYMLFVGTALVLLFSDPMVDVLQEVANRVNIPAFYVSFILAPLASNASEVIASQYYAAKKTRKTITVSLTALEGAASMNNTFCLSIFMALIFFRGLMWKYSAETISIILVQFGMGFWARRDKMSAFEGFVVMALFPLSIVFVALMEYCGLD